MVVNFFRPLHKSNPWQYQQCTNQVVPTQRFRQKNPGHHSSP